MSRIFKILSLILAFLLLAPSALASHAFSDVWNSNEYHDATAYLKAKEVISGFPDGTFKPNLEIKRVEALKILLESTGTLIPEVSKTETAGFKDVYAGQWYVKYIKKAKNLGIVKGYSDGTFRPTEVVKLSETLKMLFETHKDVSNLYNFDPLPELPSDVMSTDWYASYVRKALFLGLIKKDSGGKVYPGKALNRGKFAEIFQKLLVKKEQRQGEITACPCTVNLQNLDFAIDNLIIHKGSKVTFQNQDGVDHQIASDPHPEHTRYPTLNSSVLHPNQTFEVIFSERGVFPFHCHLHNNSMFGTIEVVE